MVLAGGDHLDPLAQAAGVASKALVPLNGKPMAAFVLSALEGSEAVSSIVYVGSGSSGLSATARAVPAGSGFAHSLALGLGAAQATSPGSAILVVTADVPWITPEAVDRFIRDAGGVDLAYPVVSREASLAAFPTHKRTFVRLKQGHFTGGNLMLLEPRLIAPLLQLIDRIYRARKNPFALAGQIGPRTLLALLAGRADLVRLEQLASKRLGGEARAVLSEDACLAADVDGIEHLDTPLVAEAGA